MLIQIPIIIFYIIITYVFLKFDINYTKFILNLPQKIFYIFVIHIHLRYNYKIGLE